MAVTKYMAIKWVKAVFEIVIAIIIIVFGNKILFGVVPADEQQRSVFSLLVGLLWFLVIWCIIVAVRNVVLSLRPEPKNSLQTLNEKIDALDKKLVTMGLASETIPEALPPSPEELKKGRNKKVMVAAGIVAAIVVLAAITTVFLMTKMGGGGNPAGGLTPEDTLNALITAMNSKDANGVLSLTVYSFGNDTMKSQFRQSINKIFNEAGSSFHVTMNSNHTKYPADLNASENGDLTGIQNEIQNHISKTVTASCMIVFNMTITVNQTNMYQAGNMPCFQIDGGWYILLDFGDGGPGGDGNGNQQAVEQTFQQFIDSLNQMNASQAASFTVAKFASGMERNQAEMNISSMWQGTSYFNVNVNSHQVRFWSMLNPTEQTNLSNIKGNVSSHFGVTITDSCFVQYLITVSNDTGPMQISGNMPCFKINDEWYLKMETSDGSPPSSPTIGLMPGSTATNWTLTVNSVDLAGGPPLNTNNVFVTVKNATGTKTVNMTLDALMAIGWVNGTRFTDNNVAGQIDSGDLIELDSSIYLTGSELKLRNSDGSKVYCTATVP